MFSLGITLYEIISGRPLPPNGEEWHSLRSGKAGMPMGLPAELSKALHEMMHVSLSVQQQYTKYSLAFCFAVCSQEQRHVQAECILFLCFSFM